MSNPKLTLADVATMCNELAGMKGNIWCCGDSKIFLDVVHNLAASGRAFLFLPLSLVKNESKSEWPGSLGYSIFVFNDTEGLSDCIGTSGTYEDLRNGVKEVKALVGEMRRQNMEVSRLRNELRRQNLKLRNDLRKMNKNSRPVFGSFP